jgi:Cdc6-like AAA superfamily ATPase
MKKHDIIPVLRYWHFVEHPFEDFVLKNQNIRLFYGRDVELRKLQNSLSNRLTGVYGSRGIGKSSLLHKFINNIEKSGFPIIYISTSGITDKSLYREILSVLLKKIQENKVKLNKTVRINIQQELHKIEHSIKKVKKSEVSGQLVFKAGKGESFELTTTAHTEETAIKIISQIIRNAQNDFIIIIDDLERVEHTISDNKSYERFIMNFARTVDDSFSNAGVSFVVSLDDKFVHRIDPNLLSEEGAFSFSALLELPSFSPQEVINIIQMRLKDKKWQRKVSDFISHDAFWMLLLATGGHPRKLFAVLRSAMEFVELKKKPLAIDVESIKYALKDSAQLYDEKDIEIVQFLSRTNQSSPSDKDFQQAIGLTRKPLANRLKIVKDKLHLEHSKSTDRTKKDIYGLPRINL